MDLTISAPSSIPSGAPGTERREARVPGTARVVGRCCIPTTPSIARVLHDLPPSGETITVSAADPLNLVGILVPGERVSATSGRFVAFRDGVALPPEERPGILSMAAAR